ncbi:MAG: hypothetical protein VW862_01710 [Euryarchaeota archaeon]
MVLGLIMAILPGYAIARRLDHSGDNKRHFLLTPALGLLTLYAISGISFYLGIGIESISSLVFLANFFAIMAIRTELHPVLEDNSVNRSPWFWIFTLIAVYIAITPLTYYSPMGVDWIGFTFLAESYAQYSSFTISNPSSGYWLYPPAFPVLAAWLGGEIYLSVFILGVFSFVALLLGIAAIGDKLGCGHWTILAILLAPALFAKNLDSGFPTVASQLGLVVLLLIHKERLRWGIISITAISVMMIHPTGLVYLVTLVLARALVERTKKVNMAEKMQIQIASISLIVLTLIAASQFDGDAIFAEYGWQGGSPMILYSGLLLPLAIWAAWTLKSDLNARVFIIWILINWTITMIYLFDGYSGIAIISMASFVLYSMSMHAFHIPLALLVGLRLSKIENGISSDGGRAVMIAALVISGVAHSALSELSEHGELHAMSEGDITLISMLDELPPDSIIYTENEHWGHIFAHSESFGITAIPTLGILKQDHSIQNSATTAIRFDDIERIENLGLTHALASPKGIMMQYLLSSTNWKKIWESGGSILFSFEDDGLSSTFTPVIGDNMRIDPWAKLRTYDPFEIGDYKHYITGKITNIEVNESSTFMVCIMLEFVGDITVSVNENLYSGSGWHNVCKYPDGQGFEIILESDLEYWLNPLGASGRGDTFVDTTGIRVHWVEKVYFA